MASAIILRADEHVIKSVNVFKSGRADITRFFNISLKPGQSKVQISRLPSSIDTESVRVSGLGNAQLFDVVCSIGRGTGEINPQSTSEAIRKLHVKKSVLAKKLDVLDSISNIMEGYSKSLIGDFVGPKQADAHFERLLTRADAIVSVRSDLEEEIFQGEVTVVIMTEQSTTVELKLAYLGLSPPSTPQGLDRLLGVCSASGPQTYQTRPNQSPLGSAPTNTAPSTSGQPSVPGNSFGGSGGPAFHFAPPPTVVAAFSEHLRNPTILQQQQQQQQQPPVAVAQSDTAQAPEAFSDWKDLSGGAITESTFVMHESPLVALTYPVEGVSSIPSDGVPHKVSVAVLPLEAKIAYVTVPKVQPVAYLHASIKNASDYHLLSGSVNAFVNDSFVSKSTITKDIVPGDVFSCALGSDLSTRIRYSRTTKRAPMSEGSFSISTTTTYVSRTTVTNKHSFPLRPFVLRDGVPTSDDKSRVRVVLRRPAGLAELNQEKEGSAQAENPKDKKTTVRWSKVTDGKGGRKEGLFEWVFEVGAGEEVTVETEWDVNAYSSLVWVDVEGVQARDTLVTKNAQDQGCTSQ